MTLRSSDLIRTIFVQISGDLVRDGGGGRSSSDRPLGEGLAGVGRVIRRHKLIGRGIAALRRQLAWGPSRISIVQAGAIKRIARMPPLGERNENSTLHLMNLVGHGVGVELTVGLARVSARAGAANDLARTRRQSLCSEQPFNGAAMPFPAWLAELRRLLALNVPPEIDAGGWSDGDVRRYYDEGFSPASTAAELRFRELARS